MYYPAAVYGVVTEAGFVAGWCREGCLLLHSLGARGWPLATLAAITTDLDGYRALTALLRAVRP